MNEKPKRVIKDSLPERKVFEAQRNRNHNRDINSKTIFDNAILCAQFLRDNIDVPVLKNVQSDDIEDVSERYRPYLGREYESDAVKRIRIIDNEKECEPVFLISLVEHKSLVDYDVFMQLLKYMMCIWIIDILVSVIENLCIKIGATEEETKQCVQKVRERKMGYLFENMEKMNIQEERRNTAEAVQKLKNATQKLDEAEKKAYEITEKGIRTLIEVCQEMGMSQKETCIKLMEKFKPELSGTEKKTEVEIKKIVEEKVKKYWKCKYT